MITHSLADNVTEVLCRVLYIIQGLFGVWCCMLTT
jgi:uncharacterized membrane protein YuzA (DUF378 family)